MKPLTHRRNDSGQGMVEYALIVGLLAVFVMAVMMTIGPSLNDTLVGSVDAEALNVAKAAISSQFYATSSTPVVIDPIFGSAI